MATKSKVASTWWPRQICQKKGRALQDADHHQLFAFQVAADLGAHLGYALRNLLARKENLESFCDRARHAFSIALLPFCGL